MRFMFPGLLLFGLLCFSQPCLAETAPKTKSALKLKVKSFKLDNGLLFLIVERHASPQVACRLAIRAGSALEENGKSGIAHLLEHMLFKGTKNFGTKDHKKDKELQDKLEKAYQSIMAEENKRTPDLAFIKKQKEAMAEYRKEVKKIFVEQAFSTQLGKNGASGINAFTSADQTQYIAKVPSDMLEQWMSIASEQLFEPSWREFYVEKEVVQKERIYRYTNNANNYSWHLLSATSYMAHPYRNPTIGWVADMKRYNTTDAMAFHKKFYNPNNAVCVLVGDLKLEQVKELAKTYFGRYKKGKRATEFVTREPKQDGERECIFYMKGAKTPVVKIGYHAAKFGSKDFYALDALTMILDQGRSSRMRVNILNKGLASSAWSGNPDNRFGSRFILGGSPNEPEAIKKNPGMSEEDKKAEYFKACVKLEKMLFSEIKKIQKTPVSKKELDRIKKMNKRSFLGRLRSNESLAGSLANMEVLIGWGYLNTYLDEINKITPADVQRVANKYFDSSNKTRVFVLPGGKQTKKIKAYRDVR